MFIIVLSAYWLILKSMQVETILQQVKIIQKKSLADTQINQRVQGSNP